jgi:hypothetical protein
MREDLLGATVPSFEVHIDPTQHRYFLQATDEQEAIYRDADVARAAGLPGLPSPPTSLFGPARPGYPDPLEFMGTSFDKAVMGSAGYEFTRLPLVGETLICHGSVTEVKVRETPKGTMTFATLEARFTDSGGELVAVERLTFIERP